MKSSNITLKKCLLALSFIFSFLLLGNILLGTELSGIAGALASNEPGYRLGPNDPGYQVGPNDPGYQPTPTTVPSCSVTPRNYFQCGGTYGLENYDKTHTYKITEYKDCHGNLSWGTPRDLGNLNQCYVAPAQPAPTSAPVPVAPVYRTVYTCKGGLPWNQFESELRGAGYSGPWDEYSAVRAYNNAACPVVNPAPVAPVVTATPTPTPTTYVPTPTPTVAAVQNANVQCPAGTYAQLSGSTVVCISIQQNQQQYQNVVATGGNANAYTGAVTVNVPANPQVIYQDRLVTQPYQPQVVYVQSGYESKQLPKTGLPISAAILSGLVPLGAAVRRFGKVVRSTESASYIWELRKFLKS